MMNMGSEDVDVQCQAQSVSASVPCESAVSYGIATVPYITSVSVAPSRTGTGTPIAAGTVMLAQSGASHTPPQNVAVQPSVPASPLPHVQVIQQPLQNQYVQHLYAPHQQHMFLPGNLTLQPAIQGIAGAPAGISLQLQGKAQENKAAPTFISATPMQSVGNFGAQSLIPAGNQLGPAKACVQGQMLATSSKSTAVIQGQSNFIPATSANQTVVISQLGVLSNPQSVLPHQAKAITDGQKGKSYLISQPATLHPKSPILPQPSVSCAGNVIATSQLKQMPSAPHIITTQAPTVIASQVVGSIHALGASLPPGLTWATPGSLHSPALISQNPIYIRSQQSDMFIQSPPPQATIHALPVAAAPIQQQQAQQVPTQQSQQPQQTQAQTPSQQQQVQQQQQQQQQIQQQQQQQQQQQIQPQLQVQQQQIQIVHQQAAQPPPPPTPAPALAPAPAPAPISTPASISASTATSVSTPNSVTVATSTPALAPAPPRSKAPARPGSSVATQTVVTTNTSISKHLSKAKYRLIQNRNTPSSVSVQLQTATTQTQTSAPPSQKADAANQTKPASEPKLAATYNKIIEPFSKSAATETAFSPAVELEPEPVEVDVPQNVEPDHPISAPDVAVVAPSPVIQVVDEAVQMEVPEEPVPPLSHPQSASLPVKKVMPNRKEVEAENIGIVAPLPETTIKEKQPQKAIVKPHVLTHVIEGFVIQEGSEPFPVSMPSYSINSKEDEKPVDSYNGVIQNNDVPLPKKKDKIIKIRGGPVELAKCENCGKLKPKAKFKKSKRFCSTSCAKKFTGNSKKLAIIFPEPEPRAGEEFKKHKKKGSSKKVGKSKKKKVGVKSKKGWKKGESKIYDENEWNVDNPETTEEVVEPQTAPSDDLETESMDVEIEKNEEVAPEEYRPPSPTMDADIPQADEQNTVSQTEFATKSPLKWTVTDVADFIRHLPGCSDYADEFRAQEIDGQALLLLKEDHLMSLMSMKLGPALKVCAKINSMRAEANH